MGGILRRAVQRALNHVSHLCIRYCAGSARQIFVGQPFDAILHEPSPPFADRMLVNTEAFGNFLTLQAFCTKQNHPAPIRHRARCFVPPNLASKKGTILRAQYNQIRLLARHLDRPPQSEKAYTMILTSVSGD